MRVNPDTQSDMLALLSSAQQAENTALVQMSSGKRVNVPSDDPSAAAANALQDARASQDDQFLQSISSIEQNLNTADSTLNSVVTALTRAISLGTTGANGTLSSSDRQSLANEVDGIKEQVLGLANTSFNGQYLFAGTNTQTQPYQLDSTVASGVAYKGNSQSNSSNLGGIQVQTTLPGSSIFDSGGTDVFAALQELSDSLNSGDQTQIESATTAIRSALDGVNSARVFYGNTVNQLQSQENFLNQDKVEIASYQNQLVGADLTTAVTNLNQAQLARQATLQAMARTQNMSLLNYLPTTT
ncbi:MAG TPA: flagellin [Candidatus Acidoferrales bacterium]|nr:flagellin [Candidatus Acidoferrales bacterium]